jgi:hypothetical protein
MGKMRAPHYILVIKPQKKKQVQKPKNKWEDTECPFIVSLSTAALSHRKPASSGISLPSSDTL